MLDDAVMPAVDYRQAGGPSPDELATVLAAVLATSRVAGVEVTIYNPTLDPEGAAGAALTARASTASLTCSPIRAEARRLQR